VANNRFYTVMVVPEKTDRVRKIIVPAWVLKGSAMALALVTLLGVVMVLDYWYVMSEIGENKNLKLENRKLRQQVQIFRNKMVTVESTMERVKTFATRLKVITNIEDRGGLLQSLNQQKIPDAGSNVGNSINASTAQPAAAPVSPMGPQPNPAGNPLNPVAASAQIPAGSQGAANAVNAVNGVASGVDGDNPDDLELRAEYDRLDDRFSELNRETLYVEQMLQDQYELLSDQKAFLAALPTRKPAVGYFTSGFGIRKAPIGGRVKMHEGLDIANRPGTPIKAPADGTVLFADSKSGYGQTVILDHGYGLETWYGHTRKILVKKGQVIRRGDSIALLGNTGRSTGPHVHYEVRVHGTPVDPLSYILEN
jgi:murein DD-endopeptidase MepM/ murein hydrolase activator NlpD